MGYLEDLKKICSEMTEVASDKSTIDKCAELSVTIDKLEEENTNLLKNMDELKKAYKESIIHGSFGDNKPADVTNSDTKEVSFENMLNEFMKNYKN